MRAVPITLAEIITAVGQLQPDERAEIAKALIQVELQSDLKDLIEELYSQTPIDEITDRDIMNEIKAVRQQTSN